MAYLSEQHNIINFACPQRPIRLRGKDRPVIADCHHAVRGGDVASGRTHVPPRGAQLPGPPP